MGTSSYYGYLNHRYWETLVKGTDIQSIKFHTNKDFISYKDIYMVSFFPSLEWRYKLSNTKLAQHWEWGVGLGVTTLNDQTFTTYIYKENQMNNLQGDTFSVYGMNLRSFGCFLKTSIHTKSIANFIGFTLGGEVFMGYGAYAKNLGGEPFIGSKILGSAAGTFYSASSPIGIKLNLSCDLNIEAFYKPTIGCMNQDILTPSNWARFQNYSVSLRYKFNSTPPADRYKRTDMFF
ncbi:MAG: hypothetical protein KG003_05290 [Bacteroidetes bacterium]|nr:hypothetical protein [Bacteroidota bacterium]